MRTLFITEHAPYPPRTGVAVRTWHRIEALRGLGPVDVFSIGERDRDLRALPGITSWTHVEGRFGAPADLRPMQQLANLVRPEPDLASADHRMMAFVFQQRPDLIVLSQWLHRFPRALKGCRVPIVLDLPEVPDAPIPVLAKAAGSPIKRAVYGLEARRREALRRELFAAVGRVWVQGEAEAERARAIGARSESVRVVPTGLDPAWYDAVRERTLPHPEGAGVGKYVLAHLGRYDDEEDEAAARWLLEESFPALALEFPTIRMLLVGHGASVALRTAVAKTTGVTLVEADDPRPYLATATVAVLLRETPDGRPDFLLAAIASGLPVVASPASVAGIAVEDGVHVMLGAASSAADAVEALWMEPHVAGALVARAYDLLVRRYGPEGTRSAARECVEAATGE